MQTAINVLEQTQWSRLLHAYGRATDTPEHLQNLSSGDAPLQKAAMNHLWGAILHQGTPFSATPPVVRFVVGVLFDAPVAPIRAALISFLTGVVQAAQMGESIIEDVKAMAAFDVEPFIDLEDEEELYAEDEAVNALYARGLLGCIETTPLIMTAVQQGLEDVDPAVRMCAARAASTLVTLEAFSGFAEPLEQRLQRLASAATDSDELCAYVLPLGELDKSGNAARAYLSHVSPAVRMCAALAPSLADDPAAWAELIQAAEQSELIDGWFQSMPPQFVVKPRFYVVNRLVEQVKDFEPLLPASLEIARITHKHSVDNDWGPLLAVAFPQGDGVIRHEAQRQYLKALLDNEALWDKTFGNPQKWFKRSGLVYDRALCLEKLKQA